MKKILYVTTIGTTINAFLVPHINMLIKNGHKVDCACFVDVPIDKTLISKGVKIFDLPFTRNPLDLKNIRAFIELMKIQSEHEYDVVHVHTPVASFYGRMLKLRFPKLKIVYTAHGFHFYKGAPKKRWIIFYSIEKLMSRFTDIIVTMNNYDYEMALKKFKSKSVVNVNGVGVDIEKYASKQINDNLKVKLGLNKSDFVITVIAELSERKNQMQVIYAVEELIKKYKNIKLLLVGSGKLYEYLNSYINEKNISENIILLGQRSDVPEILSITDVVGLFSYHEGLPRNLMEAMVAKKPIICTKIRGNVDLVKNNLNGLLVELNDIEGTKNSIQKLYKDENLRIDMGEFGFRLIENYSLDKVLDQMNEVYEIII